VRERERWIHYSHGKSEGAFGQEKILVGEASGGIRRERIGERLGGGGGGGGGGSQVGIVEMA